MPDLTLNAWMRFDGIRRGLATAHPRRVLEMGPGVGALGSWLAQRYDYTAVELDAAAREVAGARLAAGGQGRILDGVAAVGTERFDLVCAFEVLEHLEDDVGVLREWRTLLADEGWFLASTPAHPRRYGPHDRIAGHIRRYTAQELRAHLDEAGFDTVSLESYGVGFGQVLEFFRARRAAREEHLDTLEDRTAESGRRHQPTRPAIFRAFAVIAAPFRVLQRPFVHTERGIGWVVLARSRPA